MAEEADIRALMAYDGFYEDYGCTGDYIEEDSQSGEDWPEWSWNY